MSTSGYSFCMCSMPSGAATSLSSEPHSFSRVFTAAFFRMLGGMFFRQNEQDSAGLLKASEDAGKLLIEGVRRAAVVPGFYAQVAAQMIVADTALFQGRYRRAISGAFVGTGVLSVMSAAALDSDTRSRAMGEPADTDGEVGHDQAERCDQRQRAAALREAEP